MTGWRVPAPHGAYSNCNVLTALLTTAEPTAEPTIPAILVNVTPVPVQRGPLGQQVDVLARYLTTLGMRPHYNLAADLPHHLSEWTVSLRPNTPTRPGVGNVFAGDGELFASNVRPFPMWERVIADRGDRVAVFYAPGVPLPPPGHTTGLDQHALDACVAAGRLLGGWVPVRWRSR